MDKSRGDRIEMRYIVGLVLFAITLFGEEIKWANSWNEALKLAREEQKLIMLVVSQPHCGACQFFKDITLEDDEVISEVNRYYIPITLDIDEVPNNLYVTATPTIRFFTPQGKKIRYKIVGGLNAKQFLPRIRKLREVFYQHRR